MAVPNSRREATHVSAASRRGLRELSDLIVRAAQTRTEVPETVVRPTVERRVSVTLDHVPNAFKVFQSNSMPCPDLSGAMAKPSWTVSGSAM